MGVDQILFSAVVFNKGGAQAGAGGLDEQEQKDGESAYFEHFVLLPFAQQLDQEQDGDHTNQDG